MQRERSLPVAFPVRVIVMKIIDHGATESLVLDPFCLKPFVA